MDITVVGRNAEISSRLRDYVEEKAVKVEQFDPRVQRVEVEVTHERNPRQADTAERCEITVVSKGPVIRAEASSSDRFAAFATVSGLYSPAGCAPSKPLPVISFHGTGDRFIPFDGGVGTGRGLSPRRTASTMKAIGRMGNACCRHRMS